MKQKKIFSPQGERAAGPQVRGHGQVGHQVRGSRRQTPRHGGLQAQGRLRHDGKVAEETKLEVNISKNILKIHTLIGNIFSGKMHAVPCCIKGRYVIRFTVTSPRTTAQVRNIDIILFHFQMFFFLI